MGYNPNASNPISSKSTSKEEANNTGFSIPKFIPVKLTASGMETIDPSVEADVDALAGLTRDIVLNGQSGQVVTSGLVENTGLSYAVGTIIYVSKSGGITDTKPSIGVGGFVEGDFVIRLGVIVENEGNPSLRDCLLNIQMVGQL